MEAFILGLSSGTTCLAKCGSILFPYFMNKQGSVKATGKEMGTFLLIRFLIYMTIGLLAGVIGKNFLQSNVVIRNLLLGTGYISLAILLFYKVFSNKRQKCHLNSQIVLKQKEKRIQYVPMTLAVVSGLNICPPLLIAFTEGAAESSILSGMVYFFLFYLGTTIFFIPVPFLSLVKKNEAVRYIGRYASILIGFIIIYKGLILILKGIFYVS